MLVQFILVQMSYPGKKKHFCAVVIVSALGRFVV